MNQPRPRIARCTGILVLPALVVSMICAGAAAAAVQFPDDREVLSFGLQLSYRSWNIEDKTTGDKATVRQFATRAMGTVDVHRNVDLVVYGSGGFSQDRRDVVSEISGLADTKLKAYGYAWDDQLVFSLGVNIPTGITALTDEQVKAVQAVSPNVLGFRMRNYGNGTDLDLAVSLGHDLGRGWTVGGGVSYLLKGEYDLDTSTVYGPGNEFALTAGADWRRGRLLLSLDTLFRNFGEDTLGDAGTFSDGNQLETTLRALWREKSWGADVYLRHIYKDDSQYTWIPPATDTRVNNGHNLWLTISPFYRLHDTVSVRALVDYVSVDQALQQPLGAWSLGYGGGIDVRLNRNTILDLQATRLVGRSDDDTIEMSGFDVLLTIRWQF